MKRSLAVIVAATALTLSANAEDTLEDAIARHYDGHLAALFEHFHRNPELSGLENETAARLAQELRTLGYDITEGVGGTGIVGVLKNGPGPVVLLRADMDGLPVQERSGLSYASTATQVDGSGVEQPVMHACGHDVHITALVGTAKQLIERRDSWSGTLVLIGQPAEERIFGARAMMEDGLYERFPKPEYALAFHVSAGTPIGKIQVPLNAVASSSDSVDIRVHGVGTHGASPHKGVDPVLVAAQIVVSLQSLVSRTIAPLDAGVVTVGAIHGGTKHNIIGEHVDLQLTVRSDDPAVRLQLLSGIERVAKGVALSLGVPEDKLPTVVASKTETTPPVINDSETAQRVRDAIGEQFGEDVFWSEPRDGMGAEDFAYFVQPETGVKGVYFSVGGTPEDEVDSAPGHHSPLFKVEPRPSITLGAEAMTVAAMALFDKPQASLQTDGTARAVDEEQIVEETSETLRRETFELPDSEETVESKPEEPSDLKQSDEAPTPAQQPADEPSGPLLRESFETSGAKESTDPATPEAKAVNATPPSASQADGQPIFEAQFEQKQPSDDDG